MHSTTTLVLAYLNYSTIYSLVFLDTLGTNFVS